MQPNALERSAKSAPNSMSLSNASLNFSIITRSQCLALYCFQNPHWPGDNIVSNCR